jgi:hypothetical protein
MSGLGPCALVVVAGIVAGCGGDDPPSAAEPVASSSPATTTVDPGTTAALGPATTTVGPATTVAVSESTGPATTVALEDLIVLDRDGLGVAGFGDPAEDAIAAVTAVLGEPDEDSGWVEPLSIGACAGTEARYVAWGALYLYFSDESAITTGERHLFSYSYGRESDLEAIPEGLATPDGIGLGTSVEFLRAAYPDVVVEPGEEGVFAPNFYVDDTLSGRLTGGADDDLVTVIIGGDPCGVGM